MAKMRVYELAKDLKMKPKALLEKISDMDIAVRSHASSLDEATISKIKSSLADQKKADDANAGRARPAVIRKRKRKREAEAEAKASAESAPGDSAEAETKKDAAAEAASEVKGSAAETADAASEAVETAGEAADETVAGKARETEEAKPETRKRQPAKKKARPKEEFERARIIEPPAKEPEPEPEPEKISEEAAEADAPAEAASSDAETAKETPAETADSSAEKAEEATAEAAAEETETPATETASAEDAAPTSEKEAVGTDAPDETEAAPESEKTEGEGKTEKRGKRKKRGKKEKDKDTPAKIIRLPDPEEAPPVPSQEPVPAGEPEKPAARDDADAGRKRRAAPAADDGTSDRWAKKKISFKRKEVVDGADLYGKKSRKGKKGGGKGKGPKGVKPQKTQITTPKAIKRRIKVDDAIILSELAKRMGIKANEMIKKLMMLGVMATVNQTIDYETAALVASEFGYEVEKAAFEENAILKVEKDEDPEKQVQRPPVVTIMGHVDHGKTSLLDVIRKTRVTEGEAGGITQHIGAYSVEINDRRITFLDTPGHEAFTSMRARGATVTDIVILVVAADDGVMPQTVEAINHAKAAGVPIIVAVNKMDKAGADPERVMREISEQGLVPEDWGGDTIFVRVSAKQGEGIESLLEMILLQSEVLELTANPDKYALGYVVEAQLDVGRGPLATILIQEGTLRTGDAVVCGVHHGKVRAMLNDLGENVDKAGPADPVAILGLSGVPGAGDEMVGLEDDKAAKQVSEHRLQKQRNVELAKSNRVSLDSLFEQMKQGEVKDLNVIIKADVQGSIEALADSLTKLSNDEVSIRVIHSATGTVTESDVSLAAVSDAIIIGFNVRPSAKVQALANEEAVDMRFYNVIYNVIKDVKDAIVGMMDSTYEERVLGMAEVRQTFHVPKVGTIAGCHVTDGKIERGRKIRLVRDGVIIHEGTISSLKRYKDDMKEVRSGYECGIGMEKYNDIKVGDVIECFYLEEIRPEL